MQKIKLGIFGPSGRMGADILNQISKFNHFTLVSLCEKQGHPNINKTFNNVKITSDTESLVSLSDVIIDFTSPKASLELLEKIKKIDKSTALVSGTTGYNKKEEDKFLKLSKELTILRSFNMSIGVNLLKTLVNISSKNLSDISDIEILEYHHNKKEMFPLERLSHFLNPLTKEADFQKKLFSEHKRLINLEKKTKLDSRLLEEEMLLENIQFFSLWMEKELN